MDTIGVGLPSEIVMGGGASDKLGESVQSVGLKAVLVGRCTLGDYLGRNNGEYESGGQ